VPYDTVPMDQPGPAPAPTPPPTPHKRRAIWPMILVTTVVIALVAAASFVVSGPFRTLKGLQTAIAFGDSNGLGEYVDFPTLRQNLKQQLNARASEQVNAALPNGFLSRLAAGVATGVVDASVDTLVTPTGLNKLILGASLVSGQLQGETNGTLAQRFDNGRSSFESTDKFTFSVSATTNRDVTLVLTRNGLNWQLTNVLMPVTP
jgi:hypothetical protein